jgi:threonine synthase
MKPSFPECSRDPGHRVNPAFLASTCPNDGAPLLARYEAVSMERSLVATRARSIWRYREMLPIEDGELPVTLGEGGTPPIPLDRSAAEFGLDGALYAKDESQNPTGSIKARGMSAAVTAAKRRGARAGLPVRVLLPRDTPPILIEEARMF